MKSPKPSFYLQLKALEITFIESFFPNLFRILTPSSPRLMGGGSERKVVLLVVTHGTSSVDLYSQRLADHLDVPTLHTDVYQRIRRLFNRPVLSYHTLEGTHLLVEFVKKLKEISDIPHLPNQHLGRFGYFLKKPFVITVHDLARYFDLVGNGCFIRRPCLQDVAWLLLDYKGVSKACKIVVPSNHTKKDLVKHLEIPEERVEVVYHGVDEAFKPMEEPRLFDEPYILYVGSEHPRKNLATALKAFKMLKQNPRFRDLKFVKAGPPGGSEYNFRKYTQTLVDFLRLKKDVVFVNRWLSLRELASLYTNAELFVFPSLYEGFGWPPLEAMACGCPVVASRAACIPEVLGEAAIYASPRKPREWAEAMEELLIDEGLRKKYAKMGLERVSLFTWEKAAKELLRVYEDVEEACQKLCSM